MVTALARPAALSAEGEPSAKPPTRTCYWELANEQRQRLLYPRRPVLRYADGSTVPIARAFEKEGLFYRDIAGWFDRLEPKEPREWLEQQLEKELRGRRGIVLAWLGRYSKKYRQNAPQMTAAVWDALDPRAQLAFIFERENPFEVINLRGREALFLDELVSFDYLRPSESAPAFLRVGDDMGSYEVKSHPGEADRAEYLRQRQEVEDFLQGRIGHQHIVHGWPEDADQRKAMAPRYIELLDAGTWFLFWRQAKRDPDEILSVLFHPYLGIYSRGALNRLHQAVVDGDASRFKNKYRMIGARAVTGREEVPGQEGHGWLPDFELRSGNKGIKRDFMEDVLEARIVSGDYDGLRDYRESDFSPSASLEDLTRPYLDADDIATLKQFEAAFPPLRWSPHPLAHNHLRNKVVAPLLPWRHRLPLEYKADLLTRAQKRFAEGLVKVAAQYLREAEAVRGPPELTVLRESTEEAIERLQFLFSGRVRLDEDFERYLRPRPTALPKITVRSSGPLDVNAIDFGVEYSFRFPDRPASLAAADRELRLTAEAFADAMGGVVEKVEDANAHGHGIAVKYRVVLPGGEVWRVEWDGIQRTYVDGRAVRPHGGHIEIPSPKKAMQDASDIVKLYRAMRALGREPKRSAGGAHFNVDLAPLFELPAREGARKLANFIAYFESRQPMIQFLWQHPFRVKSAMPFRLTERFTERLNSFRGGWNQLGKLLYGERYFNPYVSRKPAYAQLNALAVMGSAIPPELDRTIDIKNPEEQWFPAFGGKGKDRIELRLFDAPPDEYIAALQVLYMRALLDATLNAAEPIRLEPLYGANAMDEWKSDPAKFIRAAEAHLRELKLPPKLFLPLIVDAVRVQQAQSHRQEPLVEGDDFFR